MAQFAAWTAFQSQLEGARTHVHLLVGLRATTCLADFMRELKKALSAWVIKNHDSEFGWQDGYAAFTFSAGHIEVVQKYIAGQPATSSRSQFCQ